MGDQDMATFDDADWSEDSCMEECDPGAPLDVVAEASDHRYPDFSYATFVYKLRLPDSLRKIRLQPLAARRAGNPIQK